MKIVILKKFAYGNYTRLVYKKVLGMDVKKFKELNKLTEKTKCKRFFVYRTVKRGSRYRE